MKTFVTWLTTLALLVLGGREATAGAERPYWLFESGQVRPLALAPGGLWLYAVNTPDNRLEVFHVAPFGLLHVGSVPVGLEPVAVAARSATEVWVVNHLSDSVSVVDVTIPLFPRVTRTLLVGDEPRDVVFAGPGKQRAFVTAAHRGQNAPFDPQLSTPGVGRADVWVFDGATQVGIVNLFTDTPRALAVTPDGKTVYAAGFKSGNQTTVVTEFVIPPGDLPPPLTNHAGVAQPQVGLIVRFDGVHWVDELGRTWDHMINFTLPDRDVFAIDAMATPPTVTAARPHVGTVLYNMVVNPKSGTLYVSNTEALNERRFEGPGTFAGHSVRGQHVENRITVVNGATVTPRHLNKHIDFDACCAPVPSAESDRSVALPTGMAVSSDGKKLYVAMLGTSEVAIYDTKKLEQGTFQPSVNDQIALSGGGPTGLVLDERWNRLYVMTRFDNSVAVVDVQSRDELGRVALPSPEPTSVTAGRRFLYDARLSSHGDSSCASCHVFGDNDDLGWDLGNPDEDYLANENPIVVNLQPFPLDPAHAPMKGPMTTQSMRGMANHGPMHWRGDRSGARLEPSVQPDSGAFNEREAFRQFQAGFVGLLGREGELPAADMEAFTDFMLQVVYPPNPIRNLDDSLTPDQAEGEEFFMTRVSSAGAHRCETCHTTDPDGNAELGVDFPGFFGTQGNSSREVFSQVMKIPHLRNLYTKVGKFGGQDIFPALDHVEGQEGWLGDQIRGFGVSRAGDTDTVMRFVGGAVFRTDFPFGPNPGGTEPGPAGAPTRAKITKFLFAFPSNLKPIVGQQVTLRHDNAAAVAGRIDLLVDRADAGDCDLVAKGQWSILHRGFLYAGGGQLLTDKVSQGPVSASALRATIQFPWESLTFTCVPPGSGYRIGLDRDGDGVRDGDE